MIGDINPEDITNNKKPKIEKRMRKGIVGVVCEEPGCMRRFQTKEELEKHRIIVHSVSTLHFLLTFWFLRESILLPARPAGKVSRLIKNFWNIRGCTPGRVRMCVHGKDARRRLLIIHR
jgi:hypothetical protein